VLWGSSFSGGHVLAVAAGDPRIAAVISQAPFTEAIPAMMAVPPKNSVGLMVSAVRDQWPAWRGRPPILAPAVGAPGTFAAMTEPDAKPGFDAIVSPKSLWCNEFAARLMLIPVLPARSQYARLTMPLLVCVCENDTTTPPGSTIKAAHGHFAFYHDPKVKADQVDFLKQVFAEVTA
jgi:pimeloyl-ACP methyl ester carboxylesterase